MQAFIVKQICFYCRYTLFMCYCENVQHYQARTPKGSIVRLFLHIFRQRSYAPDISLIFGSPPLLIFYHSSLAMTLVSPWTDLEHAPRTRKVASDGWYSRNEANRFLRMTPGWHHRQQSSPCELRENAVLLPHDHPRKCNS